MSSDKKIFKSLKLKDLKAAKYNPRSITVDALKRLGKSISEFGDLSGVVFNERTGTLISGHQRITTIKDKKNAIVTTKHKDEHGTIALGYIQVTEGNKEIRIPFRVVDWDRRKEKLANIAANAQGGEFDNQKLGKLLADLSSEKFDVELSGFSEHEVKALIRKADSDPADKYVRTLSSPIYKIRGKKPAVTSIYDTVRYDEAVKKIRAKGFEKKTEQFLIAAAGRLIEFNYANIAEFYAHADKKTQGVMEDLALVIIDANKAIEQGYLTLTKEIAGLVAPTEAKNEKQKKHK